jgi:hypothetical protein
MTMLREFKHLERGLKFKIGSTQYDNFAILEDIG